MILELIETLFLTFKAARKWRVIALTNNYSKSKHTIIGDENGDAASAPPRDRYPNFSVETELAFLGWSEGATPPKLRALFDDFCDSSELGMRLVHFFFFVVKRFSKVDPSNVLIYWYGNS